MELQLLSALAAVALAVLAAAVLHGDAFAAHLHATGAAATDRGGRLPGLCAAPLLPEAAHMRLLWQLRLLWLVIARIRPALKNCCLSIENVRGAQFLSKRNLLVVSSEGVQLLSTVQASLPISTMLALTWSQNEQTSSPKGSRDSRG